MNASHYVDGIELYFWIRSKEESKSNYVTQWHTTLPFLRRNKLFLVLQFTLTHWARVTFVFVSKITSFFFSMKNKTFWVRVIFWRKFFFLRPGWMILVVLMLKKPAMGFLMSNQMALMEMDLCPLMVCTMYRIWMEPEEARQTTAWT